MSSFDAAQPVRVPVVLIRAAVDRAASWACSTNPQRAQLLRRWGDRRAALLMEVEPL